MMKSPKTSIVIRAYNEANHIGRLLEGIRAQTVQGVEVILVDSGSSDGTQQIAEQGGARLIRIPPEEFTFGKSLNLGIASARGEWIVIASAHIYPVYPDWIESLTAPLQDANIGLTYGKQRGTETSWFSERRIFSQWFPEGAPPHQAHPFCNNANAAINRMVWIDHPYDETLPGLEDLEWANRVINSGKMIRYVPEAEIIHVHQETPLGVFNRYQREGMAFKRIFPQEHFRLTDLIRLVVGNISGDLVDAVRHHTLKQSLRSILWFRWNQFYGTYCGYRRSGPLTWQLRQRFYYPGQNLPESKRARPIEPIKYNQGR